MWRRFPSGVRAWLGIELNPVTHAERLVSTVGGFLGIFLVLAASTLVLGDREATLLIVGSMGASAVLLFAVPHGPQSQPWALIGGHGISALIGVTCALFVPNLWLAAALAVGLAIGAMHYLRCIHPPGGATAITAVIGGPAVHALGYQFVLVPVLLNVVIILATAIMSHDKTSATFLRCRVPCRYRGCLRLLPHHPQGYGPGTAHGPAALGDKNPGQGPP